MKKLRKSKMPSSSLLSVRMMRSRIKKRLKLRKSMMRKLRVSRIMCRLSRKRVIWLLGSQATLRWSSEYAERDGKHDQISRLSRIFTNHTQLLASARKLLDQNKQLKTSIQSFSCSAFSQKPV